MPPSGPGTIHPFADKAHFDTTYRAICAHKNVSLDLSRLILLPSTTKASTAPGSDRQQLDLHQVHLSVFRLGGEAKARAQAAAQAKAQAAAAAHAQAQAAAAQAHTIHTLVPHGIPLAQFLTQYVGLGPPYVESLTAHERFMLIEWTQLSEAELRVKTKGQEGLMSVVDMIRDILQEMRERQSSGERERLGFTTSVAVGIVLPGMKPGWWWWEEGQGDDEWDDEQRCAVIPATKFISPGLKGEPLPPPEPKMGSKASFEVVYKLISECNITETSLDHTMDLIIVPAERLPEHHTLLDKVCQAWLEINIKLAMIHDVLQRENYIKRMNIIVLVYQKTLLTKADWERRYVLIVDMLKSMLAEIQYLVGLYNQTIRSLMETFQNTVTSHGHDAAAQQLKSLDPCGYVLSYQHHVFATGMKWYILTLDQLEEWVEDYAEAIDEFIERKNAMHREQVEAHMRSMGRKLDLNGVDIGALTGKKSRNSKISSKRKKKEKGALGDEEEEAKMGEPPQLPSIPPPEEPWPRLGAKIPLETLKQVTRELFGYEPRQWQLDVFTKIAEGYDAIAIAGTGYGKSLVFALLAIAAVLARKGGMVLVISPLKALEKDQTEARKDLVAVTPDGRNEECLRKIESAMIVVALDDTKPVTREDVSWGMWVGDGRNRFYDKHQIIVYDNGRSGFLGEHSCMDGTPTLRMVLTLVAKHDLNVLHYEGYGKNLMKHHKFSPDAWVQLVKQLAFHKLFGRPGVTYESAQTRKFQLGRTEVIRSVSNESKAWAEAMLDPNAWRDPLKLKDMFAKAVSRHIQYSSWAADGQGVDRHLFGLKKVLKEGEDLPEIYKDPAFAKSSHWELSTSQLSSKYFEGWGYGEVVEDGFGLSYAIGDDYVRWTITNLKEKQKGAELRHYLAEAATEVRKMLEAAEKVEKGKL
ncbi:Carnitine O-acetyltransferase, mitochondrial [Leucoagaricus sp. SymC.cos]|nr:Carnitine O-acetyltransferase, mitochondrial [Leucoagaricus sp. SymC.cos]